MAPCTGSLPWGIRHVHEVDCWLAEHTIKPLFNILTKYTVAEQWHIVQGLLVIVIVEAAFIHWSQIILMLVGHFPIYILYMVLIPLAIMEGDFPLPPDSKTVDYRRLIKPNLAYGLSSTHFCFLCIIIPTSILFDTYEVMMFHPLLPLWCAYHISQWLDPPVKKSLTEEIKQALTPPTLA